MEDPQLTALLSVAMFLPLGFFAMFFLIIWAVFAYRYKTKKAISRVLEAMIERGDPVTPEIIRSLGLRPAGSADDLRTGIVLVTLALALFASGIITGEEEAIRSSSGLAMFPFLVGAAYLGLWAFDRRKSLGPIE